MSEIDDRLAAELGTGLLARAGDGWTAHVPGSGESGGVLRIGTWLELTADGIAQSEGEDASVHEDRVPFLRRAMLEHPRPVAIEAFGTTPKAVTRAFVDLRKDRLLLRRMSVDRHHGIGYGISINDGPEPGA